MGIKARGTTKEQKWRRLQRGKEEREGWQRQNGKVVTYKVTDPKPELPIPEGRRRTQRIVERPPVDDGPPVDDEQGLVNILRMYRRQTVRNTDATTREEGT